MFCARLGEGAAMFCARLGEGAAMFCAPPDDR
jgi:hypothetical protein